MSPQFAESREVKEYKVANQNRIYMFSFLKHQLFKRELHEQCMDI